MKNRKLIHLLLVIALVYGQFVANVHNVGHLHGDDCELQSFSQSVDCNKMLQASIHLAEAEQHHDDHGSENDCSIYHALSSLNGLFGATHSVSVAQKLEVVNVYPAGIYLPASDLNSHRIRAPPALV